jgi:hypothetical protein
MTEQNVRNNMMENQEIQTGGMGLFKNRIKDFIAVFNTNQNKIMRARGRIQ